MIALLLVLAAAGPAAPAPDPPAATSPSASPAESLRQAKNTFDYGNYTQAAAMADELVAARQLDRAADQVEAYRILGLSRFFLHQEGPARDAFLNLLSLDPDFQLDPFYVPPQAIAFFEKVRGDNQTLLQPIRDRRRATQEAQRQEEAARQKLLAQTHPGAEPTKETVVNIWHPERHSPVLALLPFGAGQFQNGSPNLGWTLAAIEIATAATSAVCYAWIFEKGETQVFNPGTNTFSNVSSPGSGTFAPGDYNTALTLRTVQISTGIAFFAAWAYGIGDAFYHYRSVVTVREQENSAAPSTAKPSPEAPQGSIVPTLIPVPGGAAGGLRLTF